MPNSQLQPHAPLEDNSNAPAEARYFRQSGLTLIQIMLIFIVVGIIGSTIANYVIDKRCESQPTASICTDRQ